MNSLIKPLFRLMVVTFIFAMLMPVSTTRADPNCATHPEHRKCTGGGVGGDTYSVAVTTGVFQFDPIAVTPNVDENTLFPDPSMELSFDRPDAGPARDAWDAVWAQCANLLGPTPVVVPGFTVDAANTRINKPGGVRVAFLKFALVDSIGDPLEIRLLLIGEEIDFVDADKQFVPAANQTSTFPLNRFWILGKTAKGVHPRRRCEHVHESNTTGTPFDTGFESTLVITAMSSE